MLLVYVFAGIALGSSNWHKDIGKNVSKSDGNLGRGPEHFWSFRVFMNQSFIKAVCNPNIIESPE